MKQIPIIRFSQFDNKWSSISIGNLAQIKRGASPRPIQDPKWFDKNSDIGWLRISDVTEQNGRIKYLEQKISKLGQEKTRVLNTPHLLLSIAATVGKPVVNYVKTGVHDGFLIFENPKFDREFMFQWFDMFKPKWNKYGQPGSQVNLNSDIIRNHKMMIPSLPEQQAIGSLFRTLDDLLASYMGNLANHQSLKATMLSKMFPKAGQTVPEIRLDGFEGEWENKILSEVTNITMGQSPKSENYTDNPNDYILVQGNADIKDKQVVPRLWTTEVTKTAEIGDIILTVRAPVGDIGKTDYNVVIGRGVAAIKGNDFIFYTLEKMKMTGFWNRFSTGSTFESISSNDIKEAIIQIPTLKEQQAIGSYFSNLDNLINSHQEKISQLETLKKKLLQDMFI